MQKAGMKMGYQSFPIEGFSCSGRTTVYKELEGQSFHPIVHHINDFISNSIILPVQIRLLFAEQMQEKLFPLVAPLPGRAAKDTDPVVGRPGFAISIFEDVVVTVVIVLTLYSFLKPVMLVAGVVDNHIDD